MGGLTIMAAALVGYLAAHVKTVFTERGLLAMLAIGGAALIGFADDWIKVQPPAQPGAQQAGQDRGPAAHWRGLRRGLRVLAAGRHPPVVHQCQAASR